ncbi:methyltransferase domain-containing protein [Polymorphobacter fuscus]|uniref:Methyltransferase domain-containing protein n=2 Tax=Sandarakinorhabdus fusca TaxID=1439888 RepID=A0A7C9KWG7_9SPHN|nr:methyltransferase domain-containing protein [Polymorphobacter fuscus]MQT16965.1 methyltransferase domain-containing protein [Polymorphobacter fuscus]
MDRIYRRQRHVYDLTRKYYLLGRDALIAGLDAGPGARVLEVGCGTGRNLIVAARAFPAARFTGLDISAAMLATARANIARAGLSERIDLVQADATAFDAAALSGGAGFDRVFLSYTVSMIPDWQAALAQAARALAPGGRLDLVDFGQQEGLPPTFRRALFAWLDRFDVTPRAGLPAAVAAIAAAEGLTSDWSSTRRGYAWTARLARGA